MVQVMKFLTSLLACFSCTRDQENERNDPENSKIVEPVGIGTPPKRATIVNTSHKPTETEVAVIATFSINKFSNSKYEDEGIGKYLLKTLSRYDLVVIQEVQDGEEFVQSFVDDLKKLSGKSLKYILGEPSGRRSKKNQLLILYRDSLFTLITSFQYKDENDIFEREPLAAKFRSNRFGLDEFAIIAVDLYYRSVEEEINELKNVHESLKNQWDDLPVLVMGNFMTGGSYCSKRKLHATNLKQDPSYVWLVEDIDTTVLKNEYTYDRIIAYGGIEDHYVVDSTRAFNFDAEFGLEMNEAKKISDHYPVEIQLGPKRIPTIRALAEERRVGPDEITIGFGDLHIDDDYGDNDGEDGSDYVDDEFEEKEEERDESESILIGSFNIQRFGRKKMNNAFVLDHLYQILSRYDLVLIQELQDQKMRYVTKFIKNLNRFSGKKYNYVVSESLGRKSYREQYMYIYRESIFRVIDRFEYDDGSEKEGTDTFAREPFCVKFQSPYLTAGHMAFVGAHINPNKVAEELDEMVKVHDSIKNKWGQETPVVFMGDFNADGSYLRKKEKLNLKMYQDKRYVWLLEDEDTTLAKNDYNYDRIVVYGEEFNKDITSHSARAYRFDEYHGLLVDDAKRISDHYPVEFRINIPAEISMKRASDEL